MKDLPDIYYTENWRKLYSVKENGIPEEYTLTTKNGTIIYPYIKRKIEYKIDDKTYYDTVTPYGFNGPIIIELTGTKEKLLEEFKIDFNKYCIDNNIIAEYVRFSPWFKNYLELEDYYKLRENNQTIAIDLTVSDIFMEEINSKRRNCIRAAIKKGVSIQFDFEGNTIEEFHRIYQETIEKNDIKEYYWLSMEFLKEHFKMLKGHIFILNALYDEKIISSSIFVHYNKQLHYLYSANDYNYNGLNGNSLLLYEAAEWGKKNEKEYLHLGGASKSEALMSFKLSYTKHGIFKYFVGSRISQHDIYKKIVEKSGKKENDYFPQYRG